MKIWLFLFLFLIGALVLFTNAISTPAACSPPETRISIGDNYQLVLLTVEYQPIAAGGDFIFTGPTVVTLTGNGCCCLYLPTVIR